MTDHTGAIIASAVVVTLTVAYLQSPSWKLRSIPTIGGSSLPLLSYIGARRHFALVTEWYEEGYARHYGGFFKVPTMDRWMVVATGPDLIKEISNMPDDKMSFMNATEQLGAFTHLGLGPIFKDPFQNEIIRRDLTRNLAALFPAVYNEIAKSFQDNMSVADDWTAISTYQVVTTVVARASNRVLVSLPLCRNQDFLMRCITYTQEISASGDAINKYPWFLKPLAAYFLNKVPATELAALDILLPEIEKRRALMREEGKDYPEKPNDFLQWVLDYTFGSPEFDATYRIMQRIMIVNFAAIHTSSATFTHSLFTLAARPEWIPPLREEIEGVVGREGMTKSAMQKMIKLDSFVRECNRTNTIAGTVLTRVACKSHTFSDGTYIPAGTFVTVPSLPHQLDERNYENSLETQPFRFESAEGDSTQKHFTTSDPQYIAFGLGKHACPGRFFAGNELKCMMAYLLLHYDIKAEKEGIRPQNIHMASSIMPNMQANIMVRKRQS